MKEMARSVSLLWGDQSSFGGHTVTETFNCHDDDDDDDDDDDGGGDDDDEDKYDDESADVAAELAPAPAAAVRRRKAAGGTRSRNLLKVPTKSVAFVAMSRSSAPLTVTCAR
jgi:hypothetical protein